jgi:predicted GIY-YIG superfamily endonuclease
LFRAVQYFVYILLCSDGTLYVGHTDDVGSRVARHNDGRGAHHTALRRPVSLAYSEPCQSLEAAVARERQIKRWSHAKKRALMSGDLASLKGISSRTRRSAR